MDIYPDNLFFLFVRLGKPDAGTEEVSFLPNGWNLLTGERYRFGLYGHRIFAGQRQEVRIPNIGCRIRGFLELGLFS